MAKSGDKCERCGRGIYYISSSTRSMTEAYQVRTLTCDCCGKDHPRKDVALAEEVRRRRRA